MATTPRTKKTITSTNEAPTKGRKGRTTKASKKGDTKAKPSDYDVQQATVATKRRKTKTTTTTIPGTTLAQLREQFLLHLERMEKSPGTIFSYGIDLALACGQLGEDTRIEDLTVDQVAEFFQSPAVTETRTGKPKSQLTIDKTRRVLRQALLFAEQLKLIDTAPIPLDAMPPRRRKDIASQQPTESESTS